MFLMIGQSNGPLKKNMSKHAPQLINMDLQEGMVIKGI